MPKSQYAVITPTEWNDRLELVRQAISEIAIVRAGEPQLEVVYESGVASGPPSSMGFTQYDDEDFDFGLFVRNVVHNPDRMEIIYTDETSPLPSPPPGESLDRFPGAGHMVVGWRTWSVETAYNGNYLRSPIPALPWPHRQALIADSHMEVRSPIGGFLMGAAAAALVSDTSEASMTLFGCVGLWGEVSATDTGWVGARAYPMVLFGFADLDSQIADSLAEAYGVSMTLLSIERAQASLLADPRFDAPANELRRTLRLASPARPLPEPAVAAISSLVEKIARAHPGV